ncbi:MAG: hypothetical protein HQ581_23995 [Planctomycetes bacterium]|nr:hypothetical protein [Planctomycetota bacterium]
MKTERRHELQTNQLADWLGNAIVKIKPYGRLMLAGTLLTAIICLAMVWWFKASAGRLADSWRQFYHRTMAGSPSLVEFDLIELDLTVKDLEGETEKSDTYTPAKFREPVDSWFYVYAADRHLRVGCRLLLRDREAGEDELDEAKRLYMKVAELEPEKEGGPIWLLNERANFGLARVAEAFGDEENLTEAKAKFADVRDGDGECARMAAQRLEDLQRVSTVAFCKRFRQGLATVEPGGSTTGAGTTTGSDFGSGSIFPPMQPFGSGGGSTIPGSGLPAGSSGFKIPSLPETPQTPGTGVDVPGTLPEGVLPETVPEGTDALPPLPEGSTEGTDVLPLLPEGATEGTGALPPVSEGSTEAADPVTPNPLRNVEE